jgi:hypothetical protein
MPSEILKDLVERVHLLQEREGSWAEPDKLRAVTDLALELTQSLTELEARLQSIETRAGASAGSAPARRTSAKRAPAKRAPARPARAKPKAAAKAKASRGKPARGKAARGKAARGKAKGRR